MEIALVLDTAPVICMNIAQKFITY